MLGSPVPSSYNSFETDFKRNKIKGSLNEWVLSIPSKFKTQILLNIKNYFNAYIRNLKEGAEWSISLAKISFTFC